MTLKQIPTESFMIKPVSLWDSQWLLLTSGDFTEGSYNAMTVGWGSIGYMWRRPFVQVVVRPSRYTYEFIERYETFTLCAFPQQYHAALQLLGTNSGRDMDKISAARLTPVASLQIPAPGYAEAEMILECRKIYWGDIIPDHFLDPKIGDSYPNQDYHRFYFGEILSVLGE